MGLFCCVGVCCFNNALTRALEISLIILNSISVFFLLLCLIVIKWKDIYTANVLLFILMLLLSVACLVLSSLIRYWRSINVIKTDRKNTGACLSTLGLTFIIISFIACLIEVIILSISFNLKSSIKSVEYFSAYITFTYLEIALIIQMIIWTLLKNRIIASLDGPAQLDVVSPPIFSPFGRTVVVVQQPVGVMAPNQANTPYIYNQQNVGSFGHSPNSNDYQFGNN